jgi:hypothetical protein
VLNSVLFGLELIAEKLRARRLPPTRLEKSHVVGLPSFLREHPQEDSSRFHVCQGVRAFLDAESRIMQHVACQLVEQHVVDVDPKGSQPLYEVGLPSGLGTRCGFADMFMEIG